LGAILAGLTFASFTAADETEDDKLRTQLRERMILEATALFAKVLEHDKPPEEPCSIDSKWYTEPVSEDIARKYLGLKQHANLLGSHYGSTPAEVMDPGKKTQRSFCTWEERKALHEGEEELASKLTKEKAQPGDYARLHSPIEIYYSFPVFDEKFEHAIIVVLSSHGGWSWGYANKLVMTAGGSIHADVWAKIDGIWQYEDSEEIGVLE
jgi:hypothetical protein